MYIGGASSCGVFTISKRFMGDELIILTSYLHGPGFIYGTPADCSSSVQAVDKMHGCFVRGIVVGLHSSLVIPLLSRQTTVRVWYPVPQDLEHYQIR